MKKRILIQLMDKYLKTLNQSMSFHIQTPFPICMQSQFISRAIAAKTQNTLVNSIYSQKQSWGKRAPNSPPLFYCENSRIRSPTKILELATLLRVKISY